MQKIVQIFISIWIKISLPFSTVKQALSEKWQLQWQKLSVKDQRALSFLVGFFFILFMGFGVYQSYQFHQNWQKQFNHQQKLLTDMRAYAPLMGGSTAAGMQNFAALGNLVQNIAQNSNMVAQVTPVANSTTGAQLMAKHSQYVVLANLIAQLQAQGIVFNGFSLQQQADNSIVLNADIVLE